MKEDEKRFFIACYNHCRHVSGTYTMYSKYLTPRNIINILSGFMHHKRCWYLLKKWCDLGFYDYGTTLDLGWFYPARLPDRYAELI